MFQTFVSPPLLSPPPVSLPTPPEDSTPPAPIALPPEAVRALAVLLREGRVVAHHPCFARLFGGAACGVLLSQFWFWTGTPTVRDRTGGWFWKSQHEITEETGLSRAETETARRRLRALGVLEEERRGIPSTLHFRLDRDAMMRRLWAHLQAIPGPPDASLPQTETRGSRTLVRGVPADRHAGIAQTTSETTSEKTQEKTPTRARPALLAAFPERSPQRSPERSPQRIGQRSFVWEASISAAQYAVNRSGTARLKAALEAALGASARHEETPSRAPPPSLTPARGSDILGTVASLAREERALARKE